jgi:hypothetical protein
MEVTLLDICGSMGWNTARAGIGFLDGGTWTVRHEGFDPWP